MYLSLQVTWTEVEIIELTPNQVDPNIIIRRKYLSASVSQVNNAVCVVTVSWSSDLNNILLYRKPDITEKLDIMFVD